MVNYRNENENENECNMQSRDNATFMTNILYVVDMGWQNILVKTRNERTDMCMLDFGGIRDKIIKRKFSMRLYLMLLNALLQRMKKGTNPQVKANGILEAEITMTTR
eukprot:1196619-Ditylum_brightwellii.AAC.1